MLRFQSRVSSVRVLGFHVSGSRLSSVKVSSLWVSGFSAFRGFRVSGSGVLEFVVLQVRVLRF